VNLFSSSFFKRAIIRCRAAGIATPALYFVDLARGRIYMEDLITACTLRDHINESGVGIETHQWLMAEVGKILATMHSKDIIHGDLTTSNMMFNANLKPAAGAAGSSSAGAAADSGGAAEGAVAAEVIMIDFGLSSSSTVAEDKAVDLYVLERAFSSTHPRSEPLFAAIMASYEANHPNPSPVVKKLEEVRARGRKRTMLG